MEELSKKLGEKARKQYLPLLLLGIGMLLVGALLVGSFAATSGNVKELTDYTESQLHTGDTYRLDDNNLIVGSFATDKSGEYFVLYREIDQKYMGLYLKGSDKTKAEAIMEDNLRYLNNEADSLSTQTISVKGKLTSMTGDEKKYFQEWFTDAGWTLLEVNQVADCRTLNTGESDTGMVIFGAIFAVIGLILLVNALKQLAGGGYKKKIFDQMTAQGLSAERVSAELAGAQSFKGADLAQTFAFVNSGKPELVPYDSLVWAYGTVHTTTHKLYGIIPAGKTVTHSVKLVDRSRQEHTITCKNEEESKQIIEAIGARAPFIIRGYSDELQAAAANNFQSLIAAVDQRK